MTVVRNPSMQMEKIDRPVHSVNCYDNEIESRDVNDVRINNDSVQSVRQLEEKLRVNVLLLQF